MNVNTTEERELLTLYRRLPGPDRAALVQQARQWVALLQPQPRGADIHSATHVQIKDGPVEKILSKWGIDERGHLAKPSQGGFGCVTESGRRVSMWEAWRYYRRDEDSVM